MKNRVVFLSVSTLLGASCRIVWKSVELLRKILNEKGTFEQSIIMTTDQNEV